MQVKSGFRKDLNGLIAIAVLAVIVFHFNHDWIPGGFSGVDVFFVISGYLMTGIIFRGLSDDNFNVLNFYHSRAKRIIPPLLFVCIIMLVIGWFFFMLIDYLTAEKHALSSMIFISNFTYWSESGYFDSDSLEKALLHTWSLSVEWQFYVIYPLMLISLSKAFGIRGAKHIILYACVAGFLFCSISTFKWATSSYFLLPARSWEMLIGGVAYAFSMKRAKNSHLLELLGLSLILVSYLFLSDKTPWPGYMSVVPVLGAFWSFSHQGLVHYLQEIRHYSLLIRYHIRYILFIGLS